MDLLVPLYPLPADLCSYHSRHCTVPLCTVLPHASARLLPAVLTCYSGHLCFLTISVHLTLCLFPLVLYVLRAG